MNTREPLEELIRDPRDFEHDLTFPAPDRLRIYDSTLRDGEQMPGVAFSPEVKYEIALRLSEIGVHIIDVGFPAVGPSERRALGLILGAKRRGELRSDLEILVMCRSTRADVDATLEVLEELGEPPDAVTFFIFTAASDLHIKYKLGRSLLAREGKDQKQWLDLPVQWYRQANLRMLCDVIAYCRSRGVGSIEYGGEDGSRANLDYIIQIHQQGHRAGGTRPSTPDTVGCYTPYSVKQLIPKIRLALPELPLVIHFHNDLGLGAINTVTGIGCGAEIFCTTINGLGERSGNASMHQVVCVLKYLFGVEIPGFRYQLLGPLARFLERASGIPVQSTEPIIGHSVFAHESGIHTAGMLIHPKIYEVIPSAEVGGTSHFVYGKHSGGMVVEHALRRQRERLQAAGVDLSDELVGRTLREIKRLREQRAADGGHDQSVERYYRDLDGLGLNEEEVVDLAVSLGRAPSLSD